ncbi:MAG: hypothetical protein HOM34_08105 [Planctomycetes bacterium]|jgi:uncharacterized membrane protein YphA (DoxX/SURF4 family)|nr:hypothetical protein [Planctomycetota bacterium]MBT4027807.1 hypothetical protein [Planctomycetota bacterium]MBT4560408.1 hypothetical protein [Planctomycetota bacterium]MBT5102355.1 hypothetical protein [Planctomycetota bacterium]MBT5120666.1 hypothetical protein [Planctomycetota bacterium]
MKTLLLPLMPWLTRIAGLVYIGYAIAKIIDPTDFLKAVHGYGILPAEPFWLLNGAGIALPWLELLGGFALLLGPLRRGAGLVLSALLFAFTAAVLWRSLGIASDLGQSWFAVAFDCGCGTGVVVAWQKIASNVLLFCATLAALRRP